jgi:hypothetical protein
MLSSHFTHLRYSICREVQSSPYYAVAAIGNRLSRVNALANFPGQPQFTTRDWRTEPPAVPPAPAGCRDNPEKQE